MNNGEICVSVCADNADKFISKVKQAAECADVIELRFDCLKETELDMALKYLSETRIDKPLLATFRPEDDWALFHIGRILDENVANRKVKAFQRRVDNWAKVLSINLAEIIDFEDDLTIAQWTSDIFDEGLVQDKALITSYHDFSGELVDIADVYSGLKLHEAKELGAKSIIVKLAIQANDITDTIPLWKLLEQAESESRQLIPIAMGEAGKWTRILGLAHGSPLTYASLESGGETAPGQISARDLTELYRVKTLDENTSVYGIIGGNTSYSMSPYIHNAAFAAKDLNKVFVPLQTANLDEFILRMVKPETREVELNFAGFSVTAPHKQSIIRHLDEIDESAKTIAAVNTIKIVDGELHGFNTDAEGFIRPLKDIYNDLNDARVAVVGAGGAARACIYALRKEGAEVTVLARDPEKAKNPAEEFNAKVESLSKADLSGYDILVNTTPLGTKGVSENETVAVASQLKNVKLVYDIVYNPIETKLLREAKASGSQTIDGLEMLIGQAVRQFEIWTGQKAPIDKMRLAAMQRL